MNDRAPTLKDIEAAARRIAGQAVITPLIEHPALNAITGGRVLLKAENLQRVGAFKFRGAYNKISQIDAGAYPGGVVAYSSGNHAQGVAAAAAICGLKAAIVMPLDAPRLKTERTRALGGEVITYDRNSGDREAIAKDLCAARRAAFVDPFEDRDIIAGQGTAGLELMAQAAAMGAVPEAVVVPASGGGLASGVAIAVRAASPSTSIHGVEPEDFDDLARSLTSGRRERNAPEARSFCDALLVATPGALPLAILKELQVGALAVSDADVRRAIRFAFFELKLVLEPGGAVALAALLADKLPVQGRTVAAVLSGGNIDADLFAEIISAD